MLWMCILKCCTTLPLPHLELFLKVSIFCFTPGGGGKPQCVAVVVEAKNPSKMALISL